MVASRFFHAAGACLTMCPFALCGGEVGSDRSAACLAWVLGPTSSSSAAAALSNNSLRQRQRGYMNAGGKAGSSRTAVPPRCRHSVSGRTSTGGVDVPSRPWASLPALSPGSKRQPWRSSSSLGAHPPWLVGHWRAPGSNSSSVSRYAYGDKCCVRRVLPPIRSGGVAG